MKRLMDIVLALVALVLLSPVLVLAALAIILGSCLPHPPDLRIRAHSHVVRR